ncbi:hypothetical protein P5G65_23300 [Paenibacillus chondroitinus]|uniref:Uncharacterized protein n=1 Tax=Paenibacillus chondroitinus TaxID=59842 RepID=A0ABU6DGF1_9BACL|nr:MULTISPECIES: hypothetical protein [Paenibacillus]MCY9659439.1 hypothetical protein [Paenibacillus anseongense]MEB4796834.1 hypothetical protein [Paenibacillus chondroitinus]
MKKQSKWMKWGIGAGCTITVALVFNAVKNDQTFEEAHQNALINKANSKQLSSSKDEVYYEWQTNRIRTKEHSSSQSDRNRGSHSMSMNGKPGSESSWS